MENYIILMLFFVQMQQLPSVFQEQISEARPLAIKYIINVLKNNPCSSETKVGNISFTNFPDDTKYLLAKECYFAENEDINSLPVILHNFLRFSVQDLIDYDSLPAIVDMLGSIDLDLSGKNLTSLEGLQNVPDINRVRRLRLRNNALTSLSKDEFRDLSQLHSLDLSFNELTELLKNIFNDVPQLHSLDLRGNTLAKVSKGAFNGLYKLTSLHLQHNKLQKLHSKVLASLQELGELDLSHNQLTCLPKRAFRNLKYLRRVYLNNNKLSPKQTKHFEKIFEHLENRRRKKPAMHPRWLFTSRRIDYQLDNQSFSDKSSVAASSTTS